MEPLLFKETKYQKTKIGNLPHDWELKALGDVAEFWNGKAHEKAIADDGDYIVINSKFVSSDGNVAKYCNELISPLKKKDIAIVMSDIPNGKAIAKCFSVDENNQYSLNQRIGGVRSVKVLADFLFYILNRNPYFLKFDDGVQQTNLRKGDILNCPVQLPLPEEQIAVTGILNTVVKKLQLLDEKIEYTYKLRKGLIQKFFSEGIGKKNKDGNWLPHEEFSLTSMGMKPKCWKLKKLEDISSFITKGATPTTYGFDWCNKETGIPFLRSECVGDSGFKPSGLRYISNEAHEAMSRSKIYSGDILISITGNIGRVVRLPLKIPEANINQHIAKVAVNTEYNSDFVMFALQSSEYRKLYDRIFTGQAYPQLSLKQVRENPIFLPSRDEQDKIAEILLAVDQKISSLVLLRGETQKLKNGLMQKLLTGKWRVNLNKIDEEKVALEV